VARLWAGRDVGKDAEVYGRRREGGKERP